MVRVRNKANADTRIFANRNSSCPSILDIYYLEEKQQKYLL